MGRRAKVIRKAQVPHLFTFTLKTVGCFTSFLKLAEPFVP
jgi:hypothetical protein